MTSSPSTSVVVLGYILSADRKNVLMLYHNGDARDSSYGKYNGLSGRMNRNESVLEAMRRVVLEDTGVEAENVEFRGVVHWSNFGRTGESLLGHIFIVHGLKGEPAKMNHKGNLQWVPVAQLTSNELPMWAGDDDVLPLIFDNQPQPFFGFMPYEHGVPRSWSYERLRR